MKRELTFLLLMAAALTVFAQSDSPPQQKPDCAAIKAAAIAKCREDHHEGAALQECYANVQFAYDVCVKRADCVVMKAAGIAKCHEDHDKEGGAALQQCYANVQFAYDACVKRAAYR